MLLLSVSCYNLLFYLIDAITSNELSLTGVVHAVIPINYFVWLYSGLYLLSPWINVMINNLNKKQFQQMLIMMMMLFSVWPTIVDLYSGITGTVINGISVVSITDHSAGYTLVQFIMLYCFGAYIKKHGDNLKFSNYKFLVFYILSCIAIYIFEHLTMNTINYSNTFVILSAIFLVFFFSNINFKNNYFIEKIALFAFPVYIIHGHLYKIWEIIPVSKLLSQNIITTFITYAVSIICMYIASVAIALIVGFITRPFRDIIKKLLSYSYDISL